MSTDAQAECGCCCRELDTQRSHHWAPWGDTSVVEQWMVSGDSGVGQRGVSKVLRCREGGGRVRDTAPAEGGWKLGDEGGHRLRFFLLHWTQQMGGTWGRGSDYSRSGRVERSTTEPKGPSISTPWDCTANSYLVNGFSPPMRMSSPELPGKWTGLVSSDRLQAGQNPRHKLLCPARPYSGGSCSLGPLPSPTHTPRQSTERLDVHYSMSKLQTRPSWPPGSLPGLIN